MNNIDMIFGAPGCGKTTYLINLLSKLLKENEPDKIAFVSFTKKGTYEGADRAKKEFNYKEKDLPYFRTIHSLAFRDLGLSIYEIISRRHYREFSKAMGMHFLGYYTEDLVNNDDKYLFQVSLEKNNYEKSKLYIDDIDYLKYHNVKKNYSRYKKEMGIMDFDDIVHNFVKNNKPLPVDIAIIDEAQDLTTLQWKFCKVAFRNCKEIYIAGDDDQAVYQWNGADVNYFLKLATGKNTHILDKSYRLKRNILNLSKKVSTLINKRIPKDFEPVDEGGNIFFYNDVSEVSINNEESYYFLSRNNCFLKGFKEHLLKEGLIFSHKNKPSVDVSVYNAIRSYEKVRREKGPLQNSVKNHYLRKDVKLGAVWYDIFDLPVEISNYYRDIFKNKTNIFDNKIMVNTIHGVKGGEADNVILKLDITKSVGSNLMKNLDSELRCLYVALTRTRKNLHIVYSNSKFGYDEIIQEVV